MERVLQLESCRVDLDRRIVVRGEVRKRLTEQETALLEYLAARPGQPVSRDELLTEVWGFTGTDLITRAVDVAVRRLRTKIEADPASPTHVLTVRHVGYRFEAESLDESPGPTPGLAPARPGFPRTTLPVERTRFVGREVDLEALKALTAGARSLVTVIGPPGVGKTRLAVQLGHAMQQQLPVAFVDAAPARTAAELVQRVADVLGLPLLPEAEPEARCTQLGHALADRGPLLLILDNLEQLVQEVGPIAHWLDLAPELRVVGTSRERLKLPAEQVLALDTLGPEEAVELFLDRARALARGYGAQDEATVERIVEDLDGLPLAIELAAARAPVLPPRSLLDGLQQRFRILGGPSRGGDPNRATLHGALSWSWSLLSPHEQVAMSDLSVFEGSFSVADAEAAVDLSAHPDAPWVLDWLQELVDKSQLRAVPSREGARFELLQSQRAFAREQLEERGRVEAAIGRHRDHVLALAGEKVRGLHGPEGQAALAELKRLADDVRAVHRRARGSDPDGTIRSAEILDALLEITGPLSERLAVVEAAHEVATEDADLARLTLARARIRTVQAAQEAAIADALEAAALAESLGDRGLQSRAVGHHAWMLEQRARYAEARERAAESLALAEQAGDQLAAAWAHNRLGHVAALSDDLESAESHYRSMRAIGEALGSWRLELRARTTLGFVARSAGRFAEAEREYKTALDLVREAGDVVREATILGNLATLASAQGELHTAGALFEQSYNLHRATGNRRLETLSLGNYGIVLVAVGRLREARSRLVEAVHLADQHDSLRHLGMMAGNLGLCQVQLGEQNEARAHLERAVELLSEYGTTFTTAYFSLHLGIVLADLDRPDAAEAALERFDPDLGDHPIVDGLRTVARGHLELARGREARANGEPVGPYLARFEKTLDKAEYIANATRDASLAHALNAVLPSELLAALRNLRRLAIDRGL